MTDDRPALHDAARTVVLGLGALALIYVLVSPLVRYAAVVASGLLLGVALTALATALSRHTRVPYRMSVLLVVLGILGMFAALVAWTGPRLVDELSDLDDAVRRGIESARGSLQESPLGRSVSERLGHMRDSLESGGGTEVIGSAFRSVQGGFAVFADAMIAIFLGVFLALSPERYVEGALRLVPRGRRDRLREVMHASGRTLRAWLAARLFLMIVIGTAFGIALALLGLPLALPIGLITGMLAFIPFVGAVVALLPALAVAFLQGPAMALQVFAVYVGIQLVETYLLDPIVESRAVDLPPALVLTAQVVSVVWFGPVAVLFATPLLVVVVVAVQMLYLQDRLGEPRTEPHRGRMPWQGLLGRPRPRQRTA